jgi:16S rRNA (guanine(966)-N(2))-methyltransferase RsmD
MRIIAGEFRSRKIKTLRGMDVRPTPDRLREALFNVLAPHLPGATFVDAYAGCGSVGIEAISRGAEHVVFLEKKHNAASMIRQNLRSLGVNAGFEVVEGSAAAKLAGVRADIVFLDPPYPLTHEYDLALDVLGDEIPPLVIVQHASRFELPEQCGGLRRTRVLKQGDNSLSFYRPEGE